LKRAMAGRPKVGGFPYLAETLRLAGVKRNLWSLPACQSLYLTKEGPVVSQGAPLISGMADVPAFDREALIRALRTDQKGGSTFGVSDGIMARGSGAVRRRFRRARSRITVAMERSTLRRIRRRTSSEEPTLART